MQSLNVHKYDHEGVKGKIHRMMEGVIPPFVTTVVKTVAKLMTHSKCMNVVIEPIVGYLDYTVTPRSSGVLRKGVGKVDFCLRYHSAKEITLPKWTAVGEIAVANNIPALLMLRPTEDHSVRYKATTQQGK